MVIFVFMLIFACIDLSEVGPSNPSKVWIMFKSLIGSKMCSKTMTFGIRTCPLLKSQICETCHAIIACFPFANMTFPPHCFSPFCPLYNVPSNRRYVLPVRLHVRRCH